VRRLAIAALVASIGAPALAVDANTPEAGRDYYSWQIATGQPRELQKLFQQYRSLPYVRVERRGNQHVLRAGFWASASAARAELKQDPSAKALIRVATYRPEAIVERNWKTDTQPATPIGPSTLTATPTATSVTSPSTIASAVPAPEPLAAPTPSAAAAPGFKPAPGSLRPFNQDDYALAFTVFLGNRDLPRAFSIASEAVRNVPSDLEWRRKLARLADWTSQPLLAWEHWYYLFQHGDRGPETSGAILRLAPLAGQPDPAIMVWKARAARASLTPPQWEDLRALFEMADRVPEASVYFEAQYRHYSDLTLLEYAAQLADYTGDDARAVVLYQERANAKPFSLEAATRAVLYLIRKDRLRDAFALMQAHRDEVPADADEFWRTLGNTAWELQESAAAESAYRMYAQGKDATVSDWSRLIYLARQRSPALGAELSLSAYQRFGRLDDLLYALDIYGQLADFNSQKRVLGGLSPEQLQLAQLNPQFLLVRAQLYQRQGEPDKAWADLRQAMALAPGNSQAGVSALWFLIDQGRTTEMAAWLKVRQREAPDNPDYWLAFAASNQVLNYHHAALGWYQKVVRRQGDDVLLLLSYADALDNVRRVGMADRVRRHAWLRLQEKTTAQTSLQIIENRPDLLAMAQLTLRNQPGDASLQLVRGVVTRLRGLPPEMTPELVQVQNLVLGWAVSTSQYSNARKWMWLNQARRAGKGSIPPIWGESQVALQLADTPVMDRLLSKRAGSMPEYNRYDTAYALGHADQALQVAFDSMQRNPDEEDMHDRFRQHAPQESHYLQYRLSNTASDGVLGAQSQQVQALMQIAPHVQVLLDWSQTGQSTTESTLGTWLPGEQRLGGVGLQWQRKSGNTGLQVFQRNELTPQVGATLDQTWNWSPRLVLSGGLGRRAESLDSTPLQVGGQEDHLRLAANYALDNRTALRAGVRWAQYQTQTGDELGAGQVTDLELSYRLRLEYPDVRMRLYTTDQAFTYANNGAAVLAHLPNATSAALTAAGADPIRYFVPEASTTVGACMDFGENLQGQNLQEIYTRAVRPFMEWCALDNSRFGGGYSGTIGLAGSLIGPDHLQLRLEQNEGGVGSTNGSLTRGWSLRYRYYF
jgi:hypothetical protein